MPGIPTPTIRDPSQENTYYGRDAEKRDREVGRQGRSDVVTVETDPKKERAEKRSGLAVTSDRRRRFRRMTLLPPFPTRAANQDQQVVTCDATVTDDAKREVEAKGQAHLSPGDYILTLTPEGLSGEARSAFDRRRHGARLRRQARRESSAHFFGDDGRGGAQRHIER